MVVMDFYSLDKQQLQLHLHMHIFHESLTAAGPTGTAFRGTSGTAAEQGGLNPQGRALTQIHIPGVLRAADPSALPAAGAPALQHRLPERGAMEAAVQPCPQRAQALIPFYLLVSTS